MTNLEMQSLKNAIKVAEEYPLLVASGNPKELLMLFQKCFMEGFVEGMKHAHSIDMKVIADVTAKR